jgi:hypothetical protein
MTEEEKALMSLEEVREANMQKIMNEIGLQAVKFKDSSKQETLLKLIILELRKLNKKIR